MMSLVCAAVAAATLFTTTQTLNSDGMNEYDVAVGKGGAVKLTRLREQQLTEATGTLDSGLFIVLVRANCPGAIVRFHTPGTDEAGGYFRLHGGLTTRQVVTSLGTPSAIARCAIGYGESVLAGQLVLYRFRDRDVRFYFDGPTNGGLAVMCISRHARAVARPFIPD